MPTSGTLVVFYTQDVQIFGRYPKMSNTIVDRITLYTTIVQSYSFTVLALHINIVLLFFITVSIY